MLMPISFQLHNPIIFFNISIKIPFLPHYLQDHKPPHFESSVELLLVSFRTVVGVGWDAVLDVLEVFMECPDAVPIGRSVPMADVVFLRHVDVLVAVFTGLEFQETLGIGFFAWDE